MKATCLWGIVPANDFSRMMIITEFSEFCSEKEIKTVPLKLDDKEAKIFIVKDSFINHLLRMKHEGVCFDTYVKIGDFEWREVREIKSKSEACDDEG